jgi:uncharacterized protein (DUF1778 family)
MKKEKIELRVTDLEKALIKVVADNKNMSMSGYIMELIYADLKKSNLY